MTSQEVLQAVGVILATGLLAVPVAALLRLPVMLVLVAGGLLVGPQALGLVEDPLSGLGAQIVLTGGVALILFHGGLGISLRVIARTGIGLTMLVLPGVVLTAFVVAVAAGPLLGVSFTVAMLVGAALAPTDPAILIPLFERIRLRPKVAQTLVAESAFNDPTGTVLALGIASAAGTAGGVGVGGLAQDFAVSLGLGLLAGVAGGVLLALMLADTRFGLWRESPLLAVLAVVTLDYFSVDELGGSAYLAAFVMGLIVGNLELVGLRRAEEHERLLEPLAGQLAELAAIAVFVTLGINLPLDAIRDHLAPGLVVMVVFILVARPLVVFLCLLPDRRGAWTREEKLFLCWSRETGVVPAALAGLLVARGVEGAEVVAAMVAIAILTTLLLQATTAGALARRLGLLQPAEPRVPEAARATVAGHGVGR